MFQKVSGGFIGVPWGCRVLGVFQKVSVVFHGASGVPGARRGVSESQGFQRRPRGVPGALGRFRSIPGVLKGFRERSMGIQKLSSGSRCIPAPGVFHRVKWVRGAFQEF